MVRCDWLEALDTHVWQTGFLLQKEENQDRLMCPGYTAESSTTET